MGRAPENEPKNLGVPGAIVAMMHPSISGTIIIPPGNRSMVALIFKVVWRG